MGVPIRRTGARHRAAWAIAALIVLAGAAGIAAGTARPITAESGGLHHGEVVLAFPDNPATHRYLSIHVLVTHSEDGDTAHTLDEAKAAIIAEYPEATVVDGHGGVGAQFQYTIPAYWWPAATVAWRYNPAGAPAAVAPIAQEVIRAGANTWNFAGGSPWHFAGGVETSAAKPCTLDGINVVGWEDMRFSWVLATTCTWFGDEGDPRTAAEFDIRFDTDPEWTVGSPVVVDLFTVAMHEFGHALGLAHAHDEDCPGVLMCASYRDGTFYGGPQADDIAGLVDRYGGVAPTATPTPPVNVVSSLVVPGITKD